MTEEATAASGRNGTSVGVDLPLQKLQGRVGRFADNGGERFMRKREFGGRRHFARIVDLVDTMSRTERSAEVTFRRERWSLATLPLLKVYVALLMSSTEMELDVQNGELHKL